MTEIFPKTWMVCFELTCDYQAFWMTIQKTVILVANRSTASFVLFISYIQIYRDTFKSVTCLLSSSCSRGFITGHSPCSGPDFFHRRGWGAMRRPLRCSCAWLADLQSGCKPSSVTVPASVSLLGLGGGSPGSWRRTLIFLRPGSAAQKL